MNWINHLGTAATVITSAEVASFCMSAVFFFDRLRRRWNYRKRWGAVPGAVAHFDAMAIAAAGDAWDIPLRQPSTLLPNPFDPRAREALAAEAPADAHEDRTRRPTFRHSFVMQRKIAQHETAIAVLEASSPESWSEAHEPFALAEQALPSPYFGAIGLERLSQVHPF